MLFHERDGDIEGKARERDARLCVDVPLALARARLDATRRIGDHRCWRRVRASSRVPRARVVCARVLMRFENAVVAV